MGQGHGSDLFWIVCGPSEPMLSSRPVEEEDVEQVLENDIKCW